MASQESADSYVGSLVTLTSNSEIRYEGFLYNINADESSIGLLNVRSYGTEGRKKDGQQVPPGDKVYEYILFRGSDVKDLQVKASPPVQAVLPDHNDPAIIKPQYSRPSSMPTSVHSSWGRPVSVLSSHTPQMEAPKSTYQGGVPLYQPGGSFGSWGSSPPNTNGNGLVMQAQHSHPPQMEAPKSTYQGGVPLYQPGGSFGTWGSSPPNTDGNGLVMQAQHSHPPSFSTSFPSASSANVEASSSHTAQITALRSTVQDGIPLYQPGGSLGSWGYSSLPNADGSGLAAPMYWQGFYGTSSVNSHAQQLSFYQTPHGSSTPDFMQQPSFPGTGASKLNVSSNLPASNMSIPILPVSKMLAPNLPPSKTSAPNVPAPNLSVPNPPTSNMSAPILPTPNQTVQNLPASSSQELVPPLFPPINFGSLNLTSNTVHCTLFPQSAALPSELSSNVVSDMVSSVSPVTTLGSRFPLVQPTILESNKNGITVPGFVSKTAPILPLPHQTIPPYVPPVARTSKSNPNEKSKSPLLLTPNQLLQPGPTSISSPMLSHPARKDVEVVQAAASKSHPAKKDVEVVHAASSKPPLLPLAINQAPLLPLPSSVNQKISRPTTRFTEEFDFMAMNEKFKKDEVWGDLGKPNKMANNGDKRKENHRYVSEGDNVGGPQKNEKPVYEKGDFFDSVSCNSLENRQRNGCRTKFSEQMKIDTETFGDFRRNQGGRGGQWSVRGGQGSSRGGRSQGFYYGRGQRYY